jgi:hypothetical protein
MEGSISKLSMLNMGTSFQSSKYIRKNNSATGISINNPGPNVHAILKRVPVKSLLALKILLIRYIIKLGAKRLRLVPNKERAIRFITISQKFIVLREYTRGNISIEFTNVEIRKYHRAIFLLLFSSNSLAVVLGLVNILIAF